MIVLITMQDYERDRHGIPKSSNKVTWVSHGVNLETGDEVVVMPELLDYYIRIGAKFDNNMQEWVME